MTTGFGAGGTGTAVLGSGGGSAEGCAPLAGGVAVVAGGETWSLRRGRSGLGGDRRRRRGCGRGCRHAEFLLQGRQFLVADIDQPLGFRELAFEILHPILERLILRIARRPVAGHGTAASGTRGDEPQMSAGGGGATRGPPGIHLAMYFAHGLALIQSGDVIRTRHAQHGSAAQDIDIAAECLGIRAIERDHGLIDVRRRIGVQAPRDLRKRIALGDLDGARRGGAD